MAEHLGRGVDEACLLDPPKGTFGEGYADELEGWYAAAVLGSARPAGSSAIAPSRSIGGSALAHLIYLRLAVDPDGRPRRLRRRGEF